MASDAIKKNITSLYFETKPLGKEPLGVIAFSFASPKESLACRASMAEFIIADVSEDKRYKRRYLELFGLPEGYDFDLDAVFNRLESVGAKRLEFSFHGGMSTQKVLKVMLYQMLLALEAHATSKETFLETVEATIELLELLRYICDEKVILGLKERFSVLEAILNEEEPLVVEALLGSENYRLLLLDLGCVILEEGTFYTIKETPILFFIRKRLKKEKTKWLKKLKKSLYM